MHLSGYDRPTHIPSKASSPPYFLQCLNIASVIHVGIGAESLKVTGCGLVCFSDAELETLQAEFENALQDDDDSFHPATFKYPVKDVCSLSIPILPMPSPLLFCKDPIQRCKGGSCMDLTTRCRMQEAADNMEVERLAELLKAEAFDNQWMIDACTIFVKEYAGTVVQRVYRGHLGRRKYKVIKDLKWAKEAEQTAIIMQAAYRWHIPLSSCLASRSQCWTLSKLSIVATCTPSKSTFRVPAHARHILSLVAIHALFWTMV